MSHKVLTFLVDSNPASGAIPIGNLGSQFRVQLDNPLRIPASAKDCYIQVKNATVWFNTPNITLGQNSAMKVEWDGTPYEFDIPTGLYDPDALSAKINTELYSISAGAIPGNVIQLFADQAESKIVVEITSNKLKWDLTIDNGLNTLLGFTSQTLELLPGDPEPTFFRGDLIAQFNSVQFYLIKSNSLLSRGLIFNQNYGSIMARINITVPANQQINYDPSQIPDIPAPELRGIDLSGLTFELTNDVGQFVNTRGEYWSLLFEIHYDLDE